MDLFICLGHVQTNSVRSGGDPFLGSQVEQRVVPLQQTVVLPLCAQEMDRVLDIESDVVVVICGPFSQCPEMGSDSAADSSWGVNGLSELPEHGAIEGHMHGHGRSRPVVFPNWGLPGYQPELGLLLRINASIVHIPGHRLDPHLALKPHGRAVRLQPQMRFGCPSASSSSLLSGSRPKPTTAPPIRRSARVQHIKESKATQAKKKQEKRIRIQYSRKPVPFTTVYIGNLLPGTHNEKVAKLFRKYGTIEQIIVRCSAGLFVSRTAVPDEVLGNRDHHYATVRYHHPRSARKALVLNGKNLDGRKLVVSLSAADLPEAKLGLEMRLEETKGNQASPEKSPHRGHPLVRQDTEPSIEYSNNRHHVFDISFSKSIF